MQEYVIDVTRIEELQTICDKDELDRIFQRARQTIVNGEAVLLTRKKQSGTAEQFDKLTTLDDLADYEKRVYKYL